MPDWKNVVAEIDNEARMNNPLDIVRRKYLSCLNQYTNRNVISYYSGFMQKSGTIETSINDNDMNAFMQTIHKLDKSKGLDLIIHTPGGSLASAISIVEYIHSVFDDDIRAFVPQLAMSAGTMIALSCKEIVMGKQSALGPIDPQFGGVSCNGIVEEFENAKEEIKNNPSCIPLWQTIINKYRPAFIGDCNKAIELAETVSKDWLKKYMFKDVEAEETINRIVDELSDHSKTLYHGRQFHYQKCLELGLKIRKLEEMGGGKIENCVDLQDCLLTIHHAYMQTFSNSKAVKIVENHLGNGMIISKND